MAEGEGFEPPKPFGLTVFKTAAIDRSAILPWLHSAKKRCGRQAKGGCIGSTIAVGTGWDLHKAHQTMQRSFEMLG